MAKENQYAYDAEVIRCHACAAKERAVESFEKAGGETHGLGVRLTRTPHGAT